MSEEPITFKTVILARYCGQFIQATSDADATIRKSSEDIMMDLRPMADISTNEIAKYMTTMGYKIGFDDATPVWLMTTDNDMKELKK